METMQAHVQKGEIIVQTHIRRTLFSIRWTLSLAVVLMAGGTASADVSGLNAEALDELRDVGVDKYLGTSVSIQSTHGDWTKHAFDPQYALDPGYDSGVRADGPVCIAGTDYSVFTRKGDPKKLLIFLQGGGACWQGFTQDIAVVETLPAGFLQLQCPE